MGKTAEYHKMHNNRSGSHTFSHMKDDFDRVLSKYKFQAKLIKRVGEIDHALDQYEYKVCRGSVTADLLDLKAKHREAQTMAGETKHFIEEETEGSARGFEDRVSIHIVIRMPGDIIAPKTCEDAQDPGSKQGLHEIASKVQEIAYQFAQQGLFDLFLQLVYCNPELVRSLFKAYANNIPEIQRIDQCDLFDGIGTPGTQHPMQQPRTVSTSISTLWYKEVITFFNTLLKESGILDEMSVSLFLRAMKHLGGEFFGTETLLLIDQSLQGLQSLQTDSSLVIVVAQQLFARIASAILFQYITFHNKAGKDYGQKPKFTQTEESGVDGPRKYPTIDTDDKKQLQITYIEEDELESAFSHSQTNFKFYAKSVLERSTKRQRFFQYKESFQKVSGKSGSPDHSTQTHGGSKKIPAPTINLSGKDTMSEDKPESAGKPKKVGGSRDSKIDQDVSPSYCRDLAQGNSQGVPKNNGQEVPKDSGQGVPKDSGQGVGVPKDSGQGVPKNNGQEVPKDSGQEDSGQEVPKDSGQDVVKDSSQEVSKGIGQEAPGDSDQVPKVSGHEVPEVSDQEVPKDSGQEVKEGSDQATSHRCQTGHTQLQLQIQPKSGPLSLPIQDNLDKIRVTKPKEKCDEQLPRQEQTQTEQNPPQNFQQLKLLAALAWEKPLSESESSTSSDPYDGWATDSPPKSDCTVSTVSASSSASKSRKADDRVSTSSRSDTLAVFVSSGSHSRAPVQCTTDYRDSHGQVSWGSFSFAESTSLPPHVMEISLLRIVNSSTITLSWSDSDESYPGTLIRFVSPVADSASDSQEQSQPYQEYIPIDSPVHSDMPKWIEECKQWTQDRERCIAFSTSPCGSEGIHARSEDLKRPCPQEEHWFLMRECCGSSGLAADADGAGISSHPPNGTASDSQAWQSQEQSASQYRADRNLVQTPGYQRTDSLAPSHALRGTTLQTPAANVHSDSLRTSAGNHTQSTLPQSEQYPASLALPCYEQGSAVHVTMAETGPIPRSAASSQVPRGFHSQTARFWSHSSHETSTPTMTQRYEPAYSTQAVEPPPAQTAMPSTSVTDCPSRDAGPAPVLCFPPIVVHAAGALPPWATTTARIDLSRAVNREYAQLRSRRATYDDDWSYNSGIDPANMALSGFFHLGGERHVRCFYCGLELNPASQDNIWDEHVRRSPDCAYLRAIMGEDMVRRTQDTLNKQKKP